MSSLIKIFNSKSFKSLKLSYLNVALASSQNTKLNVNNIENYSLQNVKSGLLIETKFSSDSIQFKTNDNTLKKYPYIWLRDHCKCSKCFNQQTEELENDLTEISIDIKPIEIKQISDSSFGIICNC